MKIITLAIITLLVVSACTKKTPEKVLRGNWYFHDESLGYSEVYLNESDYILASELGGVSSGKKYLIKNDSIYFQEANGNFNSYFKIISINMDTLWLNRKGSDKNFNEFWVRFPINEFVEYDTRKSPEIADSMEYKLQTDFDRRRVRYYAVKTNNLSRYDSLINAGYWRWDMKKVKETKEKTIQQLEKRLDQLDSGTLSR